MSEISSCCDVNEPQGDSRSVSGWWWWLEWRRCWCTMSLNWRRNTSTTRSASNWTSIIKHSWRSRLSPSATWVLSKSHLFKPLKSQQQNAEGNDQVYARIFVLTICTYNQGCSGADAGTASLTFYEGKTASPRRFLGNGCIPSSSLRKSA